MQLQIGNLLLISFSWRYTHKEPARPTAKNYVKDELNTRTVYSDCVHVKFCSKGTRI